MDWASYALLLDGWEVGASSSSTTSLEPVLGIQEED